MRPVPVRVRIAGAFALAMALVLAGTGWFIYSRLASHLSVALDRDLRLRADDLSALVGQPPFTLEETSNPRFVESGEAYSQLLDGDGGVVDATRPLGGASLLTPTELAQAMRGTIFVDRGRVPGLDEPSRLLATPVERNGTRLVLVVGATAQDRAETLSSLRAELLIVGPVALLLATIAGYGLAGLSLRPVEAMRRRAAVISAETPGERLPVAATGDEVQRLGETLNSMLRRLEDAVERERDFVADAGHELRTPLALLRTELELALRHGETTEELRAAIGASEEEVERLAQLAEDLLLIARTDKGELELRREQIEAHVLLASVATRFEWRAAGLGREIVVDCPPDLPLVVDPLRMEQALGNLVDNALRHASGVVRLSAEPCGDSTVELHVRDEGPGFPPAFLPRAFERFTRPRADRAGPGAGLGLAIVQTIARAHDGKAVALDRDGPGVDVCIAIPRLDVAESNRALEPSSGKPTRRLPTPDPT
jgi:two-component system OmpR family sensor kinase